MRANTKYKRNMLAGCAMLVLALLVIGCESKQDTNAPFQVTKNRLKESFEPVGLTFKVVELPVKKGQAAVFSGIATSKRRARAGFEYRMMKPGVDPSASEVCGSRRQIKAEADLPQQVIVQPYFRGVLGNVAYCFYSFERTGPKADDHPTLYDDQPVSDLLDKALVASFPKDDPEAHPILNHP